MPLSRKINTNYRQKKSKKRKAIFFSFIFGIILAGIFYFFWSNLDMFKKKEQTISADAKVEVPATEAAPAETVSVKSTAEVEAQIENYLKTQAGEYAYQVTEMDTGRTYGARFDNSYRAASTIKVAIASYLFNQVEQGKVNLDKSLTYTSADFETGTGILQGYKTGTTFKVGYLVEIMLSKSDNIATNMLIRYLGRSNIQTFLNANGLPKIVMATNTVTPASMNQILAKIENRQIVNNTSATKILTYMTGSLDPDRIVAGVPANVRVAHKIGTATGALSDIGIIYLDGKKYILSVYSKGVLNETTPKQVIKNISKMVYSFESSR